MPDINVDTLQTSSHANVRQEGAYDIIAYATRCAERLFLPVILSGIGLLLYWIWFGESYSPNVWWQLFGSLPLILAFAVIALWFIGICLMSDP